MSILTVVGIDGNNVVEDYLNVTAHSVGLLVEVIGKNIHNPKFTMTDIIEKTFPKGQWVAILNPDGELDLDISYNLNMPFSSNSFGLFLLSLVGEYKINEIVVLFYDLGTNEKWKYQHPISDIEEVLRTFYQMGGPSTTVTHSFKRYST